ncbi:cytokinesis protein 3 [Physocladia obscura]|uniref:Cytokinesis protein 3 n=1 Tax=Physocladia obscura TaxID=109957 RepID=A0AAD5T618_9FUNG|nr:cytokinesis protein 3 [Physocladia obscura]
MSGVEERLQRLNAELQTARDKIAKYELQAVNAQTDFQQKNSIRLLQVAREDIRRIEAQIIDHKVQQGIRSADAREQQLQSEFQVEREKCDRYEQKALEAETEPHEKNALRLLDNAREEIRDIEARFADLQLQQGLSHVEVKQYQLLQLENDRQAATKKFDLYIEMTENSETEHAADKAHRLKENASHHIRSIDARIIDLKAQLEISSHLPLNSRSSNIPPIAITIGASNSSAASASEDLPITNSNLTTDTNANSTNRSVKLMISYCWSDKVIVHAVAQFLRDNNFNVWLDNTNMTVEINEAIPAAIDEADAVIAFISKDSVLSRYCKRELDYANDKHKQIIPVRLTDLPTPGATDFLTAGKLYVPLYPSIWDNDTLRKEHLGYLLKNIASETVKR